MEDNNAPTEETPVGAGQSEQVPAGPGPYTITFTNTESGVTDLPMSLDADLTNVDRVELVVDDNTPISVSLK